MLEYAVRGPETSGSGEIEKICNYMAQQGWRLASTAAVDTGALRTRVFLFFEREVRSA